jgi:hypothetical protein
MTYEIMEERTMNIRRKIKGLYKLIDNRQAGLTIAGSVFVALALIVIFGVIVGSSLNEIKGGLGNLSLVFAAIAFIVLIIIAVIAIAKR